MVTYAEVVAALVARHATDWTQTERDTLTSLITQLGDLWWKKMRGDDVSTAFATLKTQLKAFAQTRKVKPGRIAKIANLQFALRQFKAVDYEEP